MEDVKFDGARLEALEREFRESGQDIDTFLRDRLRESGRPEVAEDIIGTMAEIDANYADIQKAQADGFSRKDWLNRKFNALLRKSGNLLSAVNPAKFMGELIARIGNALTGKEDVNPEEAEFAGREAGELVESLDDALTASALAQAAGAEIKEPSSEEN